MPWPACHIGGAAGNRTRSRKRPELGKCEIRRPEGTPGDAKTPGRTCELLTASTRRTGLVDVSPWAACWWRGSGGVGAVGSHGNPVPVRRRPATKRGQALWPCCSSVVVRRQNAQRTWDLDRCEPCHNLRAYRPWVIRPPTAPGVVGRVSRPRVRAFSIQLTTVRGLTTYSLARLAA